MSVMVPIYADLVRKGVKTLDTVPAKLRADVEAYLLKEENKNGTNDS